MAASVRLALYERLASHAPLMAAVSGIYHQDAPQSATHPFVVFFKQAGTPRWTMRGQPVEWELWTCKVVGKSSSETEPVAELIDDRLNDAPLAVDGRDTLLVLRESDVSYPEPDGADVWRHLGGVYRIATG